MAYYNYSKQQSKKVTIAAPTPSNTETTTFFQLFDQFQFPLTLLPPSKLSETSSSKQDYQNAIFHFRNILEEQFGKENAANLLKFHNLPYEFKDLAVEPLPLTEPLNDLGFIPIPPFEKSNPKIELHANDIKRVCKNPQKISNKIWYLTAAQDYIMENISESTEVSNNLLQNTIDIYSLINTNPGFVKDNWIFAVASYVKAYDILWDIGHKRPTHFLECNHALVCKTIFCLRYFIHLYRILF